METHERDVARLQQITAHADELIRQIQLDILGLQKIIKLNELAAARGWPPYLPSPITPAEEDK